MTKKFKLKLSNFKSSSIYIILISIIFFSYVLVFANIHGDWRHNIDSEILWPYNVLLILSNQRIEFDAYGFFYFFLEYKFFQILNLFEILKTSNIQDLNNGIYFSEKLENLIFAGRWFNLLVIYTTLITAFCIFKNLSKNSVVSFILVLIFMFSPGMVQQLSHARVDILVSTLIFISFFFLIKFSEDKKKLSFILFIIFFLLAIFTKVQSYLFLFALLISSAYFIKHETESLNQNNLKIWISLVLLIFILYCIFYPIIIHRHAKFSIIFLYSQLILLNGYIYYIFRNLKNVLNKNLIFTSITFFTISIFILLIKNLDYMNIHAVRLTFFEPMEIRMYITETNLKGMDVITLDLKKNITYFYLLFNKIFTGFASTSILIFKNLSSNLLLIILNLISIFYFTFIKKIKKKLYLLLPLISFFIINGINNIRGQGLEIYLTYSEFLLYIPICIFFSKNNVKFNRFILTSLLVILILPIIISPEKYNKERYYKENRFNIWCDSFMKSYTKQISQTEIKKICN